MIEQFQVTSDSWVAITNPGDSGSCWLDDDKLDFAGRVDCRITESSDGIPTVDATFGRRLFGLNGNSDSLLFSAGNARAVIYARCANPGDVATVCVCNFLGYQREIDTNAQTQVGATLQYYLIQELKTNCALSLPISVGDSVFNLAPGHGFTAASGEMLVIRDGDVIQQCSVISVNVNAITVCSPSSNGFGLTAQVIRGNRNMNKDFSGTPGEFRLTLHENGANPWDVKQFRFIGQSGSTVPDDGTFFGLPELAVVTYLRRVNGTQENLGTFKKMSDFKYKGFAVTYDKKAPSGTESTTAIIDFEEVYGQQKRIDPRTGDYIVYVIRSNLSSLTELACSGLCSITSGE